jgi:hypothetical protein
MSLLNVSTISSDQRSSRQVSRVPLAGGVSELLVTGDVLGVRCSRNPANLCVMLEESPDHKQFIFSKLDSLQGRGSERVRINREDIIANYEWALSPDGTMVAFAKQFDESIRLIPLNGQIRREVRVQGWHRFRNITFAADGKSFFASHPSKSGAVLLHVNENGVAKVLWEVAGQNVYLRAIPSPDGRTSRFWRAWSTIMFG